MNTTAVHLEELAVVALLLDKNRELISVNANGSMKHGKKK
jgi:hypothetical protein